MKKIIALIMAALLIFAAGCTAKPEESETSEGQVKEVFSSYAYMLETDEEDSLIKQYGESKSIVYYTDNCFCAIDYPETGFENPDSEFKSWAESYEEKCKSYSESQPVDFVADYNSYKINEAYAGIKEIGCLFLNDDYNSEDVVLARNIDLTTGEFADIYENADKAAILEILKSSLESTEGVDSESISPDESWLNYSVLTDDALEIILPKGEYLNEELGTLIFPIPYSSVEQYLGLDFEKTAAPAVEAGRSIDPNKPMVALTFDDGPSKHTPHLLDLLKQYDGVATFCMVGERLEDYSETVNRVVAEGSQIATHTWDHAKLTALSDAEAVKEMTSVCDSVRDITGGYEIKMLRPPYGSIDKNVEALAGDNGLYVVNWSIDTLDWKTKDAQSTFDCVKNEVQDGSIILCHDLYEATSNAMDMVIPWLAEQGYQMVTVDELLYYKQGGGVPGQYYLHG